jgi:hypothetical protein
VTIYWFLEINKVLESSRTPTPFRTAQGTNPFFGKDLGHHPAHGIRHRRRSPQTPPLNKIRYHRGHNFQQQQQPRQTYRLNTHHNLSNSGINNKTLSIQCTRGIPTIPIIQCSRQHIPRQHQCFPITVTVAHTLRRCFRLKRRRDRRQVQFPRQVMHRIRQQMCQLVCPRRHRYRL